MEMRSTTDADGVNVTGFDHLALVVDDVDLAALATSGRFGDVAPPRRLFGARGTGLGIYVLDPDGHTVELRTYDVG
ncbi:MAG: VOC family protein [Ilumatobacteraceae bacterium]